MTPTPPQVSAIANWFGSSRMVADRIGPALSGLSLVVVRFADHPMIRELYPATHWTWVTYPSRAQTNGEFDEVLLVRNE